MKKVILHFITIASIFMCLGCKKAEILTPMPTMSFEVRIFLLELIDVMKNNSVNRFKINWPAFTAEVLKKAENAKDFTEAEPAIKQAIILLNDNHSSFFTKTGKGIFYDNLNYKENTDNIGLLPVDVGYIKVGGFNGIGIDGQNFAINLQKEIKKVDRINLKGWIVDLRGNSGGNMWPMIAGLGPILGEGLLGYFIDPLNGLSPWNYKNGSEISDIYTLVSVPEPYTLIKPKPKVAVLINYSVASSGEATAIAFKGRPNTRFFGTPTFGLTTANKTFNILDAGTLNLSISTMADRNQVTFSKKVEPDFVTNTSEATNEEAIKWIIQ